MRVRRSVLIAATTTAFLTGLIGAATPLASAQPTEEVTYLVLFNGTVNDQTARRAITEAGGRITETNTKIGYAYVRTNDRSFAETVAKSDAVVGVAKERTIGVAPNERRARSEEIEKAGADSAAGQGTIVADAPAVHVDAAVTPEPLANRQWDMRQIGATATGSYAAEQGRKGVRVGIIDTGVDGTHPDIAPNFDKTLSRNFVTDMTDIDGPCEYATCIDPVDEDDNGHGTHVASTIGSPINGLGIAGVAPNVTLVNLRAGQDSGYFFLKATLDALTYAGDIGIDVVNMSYYVDPWLYNCTANSADTPAEQEQQQVIRQAVQRAMTYARNHGVLPVAALGNEATDLNRPTEDGTSPDYPVGAAKERTIDNSCISVPTETRGVVGVSSTGPSTRKAYYSNWGTEQTDVAAPGGDAYDTVDNTLNIAGTVLAAYPKNVAEAAGTLNPDGTPNTPSVVRDCKGTTCAYYQYLQGTSMASPHAAGVAALIVGRYGHRDGRHGLTLSADRTEKLLYQSAVPHACPQPRLFHYTRVRPDGSTGESDARCAGGLRDNGFYGHGIVNAYAAVTP
jgi:lantibiotic leader peptide-processing serine protease